MTEATKNQDWRDKDDRPKLYDEIIEQLTAEPSGWLSMNALLNRCPSAKDGSSLTGRLQSMVRDAVLQHHSGTVGLLYGLPGKAMPTNTPQPSAPKPLTARDINLSTWEVRKQRDADRAPVETPVQPVAGPVIAVTVAPVATMPDAKAPAQCKPLRDAMIEMFRELPSRLSSDFEVTLERDQTSVSEQLREFRAQGLVEMTRRGRTFMYRWLLEPGAEVPAPPAQTLPPELGTVSWREKITALFQAKPEFTVKELSTALGRGHSVVSGYLRLMCDDGDVKMFRLADNQIVYRWRCEAQVEGNVIGQVAPEGTPPAMQVFGPEKLEASKPAPSRETIKAARADFVGSHRASIRQAITQIFEANPQRTAKDFMVSLGKSQTVVSGYLRAMCDEGLVTMRNLGRKGVLYLWNAASQQEAPSMSRPGADVPAVEPSAAAESSPVRVIEQESPSPAPAPAEVPAGEAFDDALAEVRKHMSERPLEIEPRFGIWSDGSFEIQNGAARLVLKPADTKRLVRFVQWIEEVAA